MEQNNDKVKAWQVLLIIAVFAFCAFFDDFINLIF